MALALAGGNPAWAYTDGAEAGDGFEGCAGSVCHTSSLGTTDADSRVLVKVEGLPQRYVANTAYPLSVRMDAPAEIKRVGPEGAVVKSGLAVDARVGEEPLDRSFTTGTKLVRLAGDTLTHTREGAKTYNWTFSWVSPAVDAGPVELYVTAMASAGSPTNTDRDSWNTERFIIWPAPVESPGAGALVAVVVLGLGAGARNLLQRRY